MKKAFFFVGLLLWAYAGKSQVSFTEVTGTTFPQLVEGDMETGDFDKDGDEDFILTGQAGSGFNKYPVTVQYENDGAGNFSMATNQNIDSVRNSSLASADIDMDGDIDIFICGQDIQSNYVSLVYENDGNGVFTLTSNNLPGIIQGAADFGDADGDKDPDLIISGYSSSGYITSSYMNDGTGIFIPAMGTSFSGTNYANARFLDSDNDNDLDILIAGDTGTMPFTELYTNNGSGIFTLETGTGLDGLAYGEMDISDVDDDGDIDIVFAGYNGVEDYTRLYLNDGAGVFTVSTGSTFPSLAYSTVEFGDVDLDKDEDLLLSGYHADSSKPITLLYENDGEGIFTEVGSLPFPGSQQFPNKFIDIDGDNDPDVYISGSSTGGGPNIAALYKNNHCSALITSTDTRSECAPFTWIDGKTYTESNDSAEWTLVSAEGCDSVVTLKLTINKVDTSVVRTGEELTANASAASYQWLDCENGNAIIDGETGKTYSPTKSGDYAVEIKQNNCTDTSSCFTVILAGIDHSGSTRKISVYPNVTHGPLHINMGETKNEFSVVVSDMSGRTISQYFYRNTSNEEINLAADAGMYLVTIFSGDQSASFRVVKE